MCCKLCCIQCGSKMSCIQSIQSSPLYTHKHPPHPNPHTHHRAHKMCRYVCMTDTTSFQWRNRRGGGGAGGRGPPRDFWPGNSCWVSGKKRQGKKGKGVKIEKKRKKIGNGSRKTSEKEVRPFFFFFFFFFFFAFHFWKRRKFVLGLPKWEFSTGKKHFTPGKKSGKMTLPPQKNMPVTPLHHLRAGLQCLSQPIEALVPSSLHTKMVKCAVAGTLTNMYTSTSLEREVRYCKCYVCQWILLSKLLLHFASQVELFLILQHVVRWYPC